MGGTHLLGKEYFGILAARLPGVIPGKGSHSPSPISVKPARLVKVFGNIQAQTFKIQFAFPLRLSEQQAEEWRTGLLTTRVSAGKVGRLKNA